MRGPSSVSLSDGTGLRTGETMACLAWLRSGAGSLLPLLGDGLGPGSGSGSARSMMMPSKAESLRSSSAIPKASVPVLIRLAVVWRDPAVTAP